MSLAHIELWLESQMPALREALLVMYLDVQKGIEELVNGWPRQSDCRKCERIPYRYVENSVT